MESLQRGIEENIKPENLILEINSSKHAYNVTISEVIETTTRALLSVCLGQEVCNYSQVLQSAISFSFVYDLRDMCCTIIQIYNDL